MTKDSIISKCKEYGEFYLYYTFIVYPTNKQNSNPKTVVTVLQGTMDFDDNYLSKLTPPPLHKGKNKDDYILVWSRTGDGFKYIPVDRIRRITSLNYELDKADGKRKKS